METTEEKLKQAANRFMRVGETGPIADDRLGLECDKIIQGIAQKSISRALNKARSFNDKAESIGGPLRLTSRRTLARMLHISSRHAEAEQAYLKARSLSNGDNILKARIDRALIDVYMYLGQYKKAARRANMALEAFEAHELSSDIAMTYVNYANLLHRQDRHREAEKLYGKAEAFFREQNFEMAVARCAYNRGNTLVQLFEMDEAEKLFTESYDIYSRIGYEIDAIDARYGLAWLHMLQGKFHRALKELTACSDEYRKCGQLRGVNLCLMDRAEIYLSLNLMEEARLLARQAEQWFRKKGFRYESSKAAFFRAIAARTMEAANEFDAAMKRAIAGFKKCQNEGFLGAAHYFKAMASQSPRQFNKVLGDARGYFERAQLPLWQAYCDLAAVAGGDVTAMKRLKKNPAIEWVPHLYAQWHVLQGDQKAERGNVDKAREHWKKAADRLDAVKAGLPPLELRSGYSRNLPNPHRRLIKSDLLSDPARAGAWLERFKMSGMWSPLAGNLNRSDADRVHLEESLQALSNQISIIAGATSINKTERWSRPFGNDGDYTRNTRRKIREQLALLEKYELHDPDDIETLSDQIKNISKTMPVVQFYIDASDVFAVVHVNGQPRVIQWKDGRSRIESMLRKWRFLLEKEIQHKNDNKNAAAGREKFLFTEIGDYLWSRLELPPGAGRILIIPDGDMANLPWQAVLANGTPLIDLHDIIICPSLRHYLKAASQRVRADNVEVFVGRDDDLGQIENELRAFGTGGNSPVTIHNDATREHWPTAGAARAWHYTGHTFYNPSNPFYSYLDMHDGPFFAVDFRLRDVKVGLVTLASCRSGEQMRMPGEESTGLVRSLLEMGSRNVIAAHWPVADNSTALWMSTFYGGYLNGKTIGEAFRAASLEVRGKFPSAYHWAAFSIFGAGA